MFYTTVQSVPVGLIVACVTSEGPDNRTYPGSVSVVLLVTEEEKRW